MGDVYRTTQGMPAKLALSLPSSHALFLRLSSVRKDVEISSTSSRLEAEEALNAGLQRKNKELQVRPRGRAAAFLSFSAVGVQD